MLIHGECAQGNEKFQVFLFLTPTKDKVNNNLTRLPIRIVHRFSNMGHLIERKTALILILIFKHNDNFHITSEQKWETF